MASKTYQIAFALGAKLLSNFNASFNAASNSINKLASQSAKTNKGFLGLGEGATKAFKAAAGAAAGIGFVEVVKKSIELASNLVEVQNVVDTTFGSSSKQIDAWSGTALKAFGLSELQAKQFNGTMGALMKSSGITGSSLVTMSENLTGLSGDFASFYNLPIEEAFEKIKSGISGETEPLKALGVNMSVANLQAYALSQGITKSWNSMSQAEQVQLRYNYLMNVSKDAQGDFAKTQTGFANQLRIAKTNLAQMGATLATNVLPYLNKLLLIFNNGAMGSAGSVLKNVFSNAINVINSLKPNVENLWNSIVKFTHISGLDKLWSSFSPTEAFNTIQSTLKNILDGFTGIANFVNNNFGTVKTVIEGVALGVASYGIALAAVTIKEKAALIIQTLSKAWWMATGIIGAYRNGMTLAAIAQDAFNVAMAANPVGVFAIAIGIIIGLVVLIYKNWGSISKFFSKVWADTKVIFNNFWNWIKGFFSKWGTVILAVLFPFIGIPVLIVQHWNQIKSSLSAVWNSIKTSVSNAMSKVWGVITSAWSKVVTTVSSILSKVWQVVVSGFKAIGNAITHNPLFIIVSAIFKGILAVIIIVVAAIYTKVTSIWNRIHTAVSSALTRIWQVITRIWNSIYTTVAGVVNKVWSVIVSVWNTIYSTVSSILTKVWSFIVSTWNSIYTSVSSVLNTIWNVIVTIWNTIYNSVSAVLTTIWNFIVTVWNNIYNSVSSVITSIWNTIVNGFNSASSGVTSIFSSMYNTIVGIFQNIWGAIKSIINGGIGMVNGFIGGVNSVIGAANKVPGVNIGVVSTIPQLANGGYIKHRPGGILANIGEGREDEIVSPVSKLKNIIKGNGSSIVHQPTITYAPQIIIQGNASKEDVAEALSMSQSQFNRMMDNYTRSRQRLSLNQ